jgi:hypothetical protein
MCALLQLPAVAKSLQVKVRRFVVEKNITTPVGRPFSSRIYVSPLQLRFVD